MNHQIPVGTFLNILVRYLHVLGCFSQKEFNMCVHKCRKSFESLSCAEQCLKIICLCFDVLHLLNSEYRIKWSLVTSELKLDQHFFCESSELHFIV